MTELTEELVMVANNLVKLLKVFDCNDMNDIEKYESLKNEVEELTERFENNLNTAYKTERLRSFYSKEIK